LVTEPGLLSGRHFPDCRTSITDEHHIDNSDLLVQLARRKLQYELHFMICYIFHGKQAFSAQYGSTVYKA